MKHNFEGISLNYRGCEWTPDGKIQYVCYTVQGNCDGYSGRTQFETTGPGITLFVQELDTFVKSLSGRAELTFGVGNEIYFKIELSWHDRSGHALMECTFRESPRGNYFQCAKLGQIIEYAQVVEIRSFFAATLSAQDTLSLNIPLVR